MSPLESRIRPATPADVGTLLALIRGLAEYERLEDQLEVTTERLATALFGERPVAEAVLAEAEDQVVGFALFFTNFSTFLGLPGLYLEDLYVRPEFRGRGHGTALLRHLARLARDRGCGRFEWSVLDWNEPAQRFYQAHGASILPDWRICRVTGEALQRLGGA